MRTNQAPRASSHAAARAGAAELLADLEERVRREISICDADLLRSYPVEHYLRTFQALPAFAPYGALPPAAASFCQAIEARAGGDALEAYHRLAMIRSIAEGAPGSGGPLTDELAELLQDYLLRLVRGVESPRKGFYVHANDQFAKDFAVCRGKLLPCGVELIDWCSGVPRRTLLGGGLRQFASGAHLLATRAGGIRPFYELHFDRRSIPKFNDAGYTKLYLRLADLLALDPRIRGVMSSSWWHDPRLADISPELAFIDRHPRGWGARLLFVEENENAAADATRFSPRRTALHAAGLYRPRVYLLVWARRDILAWAEDHRSRA